MIVLGCEKIGFSVGVTEILSDVTFSVEAGERVGLVGVNGAGKSTLIRIVTGENRDYTGQVYLAADVRVGVLEQNAEFDSERSLLDEMLDSYAHLARMEEELAALQAQIDAGNTDLAGRLSELNETYIARGGLEYRARCAGILKNLGFSQEDYARPVCSFSGGQKTRVALARVLSAAPDLLILDEPTNHLDIDALAWLEDFLRAYRGTVMVVSHDRYFLDRVTTKTVEIEHGKSRVYRGNYSFFSAEKKREREIQQHHYDTQQSEIRRQEAYIEQQKRWNRERNIIAARSRQKALDRMERVERPDDLPEDVCLTFAYAGESGNEVLNLEGLSKRFGDHTLFSGISLGVRRGDRLFISGANGSGKSTLIKILNGFAPVSAGSFEYGYHVLSGYYDQENQQLSAASTVLDELWRVDPGASQTAIRSRLALFLFKGDDIEKRVADLSGGEKARLTLAKLSMLKTNLLILDEPTNHLDIGTREVLEEALAAYEGTVIAVSHDRYFVEKLATRMLYLPGDGTWFAYDGGYRDFCAYRDAHGAGGEGIVSAVKATTDAKADYLEQKRQAAEKRKQEQRVARARAVAERLEGEIEALDAQINAADGSDYLLLSDLYAKKEQAETELLEAYEILEEA